MAQRKSRTKKQYVFPRTACPPGPHPSPRCCAIGGPAPRHGATSMSRLGVRRRTRAAQRRKPRRHSVPRLAAQASPRCRRRRDGRRPRSLHARQGRLSPQGGLLGENVADAVGCPPFLLSQTRERRWLAVLLPVRPAPTPEWLSSAKSGSASKASTATVHQPISLDESDEECTRSSALPRPSEERFQTGACFDKFHPDIRTTHSSCIVHEPLPTIPIHTR